MGKNVRNDKLIQTIVNTCNVSGIRLHIEQHSITISNLVVVVIVVYLVRVDHFPRPSMLSAPLSQLNCKLSRSS